jgi:hypothetical protein
LLKHLRVPIGTAEQQQHLVASVHLDATDLHIAHR